MSVVLNINEINSNFKNGKLNLSLNGSLDLLKNPNNYKYIDWLNAWGIKYSYNKENDETHIILPHSFSISDIFYKRESFLYLKGFSKRNQETLNHNDFLSYVFSKFYINSGICKKSIGFSYDISELENSRFSKMKYYNLICNRYEYKPNEILFTKDHKDIEGCYLYMKDSLLKDYGGKMLVIDGKDNNHLTNKDLNKFYKHKNIGSISFDLNSKDSFKDLVLKFESKFKNYKIAYNSMSGLIFEKNKKDKSIKLENLEKSKGLFLTETLVKLKNLGEPYEKKDEFSFNILQFGYLKTLWNLNPHFLFDALVKHCENINNIYNDDKYNLSEDVNVKIFLMNMLEDLELGMRKLGMFIVDEI